MLFWPEQKCVQNLASHEQHEKLCVRTSNIPHVQLKPVSHQRFDIEALCRHDMGDVFLAQSLEDGRLPRIVETQHQQSRLVVVLFQFS